MRLLTQIYEWNIQFKTLSPLHIGDEDDHILVDQYGKPFIPGTSLAGACRNYLEMTEYGYLIHNLFGEKASYRPKEGLIFTDSYLQGDFDYDLRPSVRIDGETRTAENKGFFERMFIAPGALFKFNLTLYASGENATEQRDAVEHLLHAIHHGIVRIGALQSIGGGQVEISSCQYRHYNCQNLEDLHAYVNQSKVAEEYIFTDDFKPQATMQFIIKGETATPLLIASSSMHDSSEADAIPMKTKDGKPLIPGSSLKGLLRHRVERITNALSLPQGSKYIEQLFGQAPGKGKTRAGSLQFRDVVIKDPECIKYYRTSINPLTGSVRDGALLNEETVSGKLNIKITLSYKEKNDDLYVSAALLLFALRDLALQELSIGSRSSIGYGFIDVEKIEVQLEEDRALLSIKDETIEDPAHLLQSFNQALQKVGQSQEVKDGV